MKKSAILVMFVFVGFLTVNLGWAQPQRQGPGKGPWEMPRRYDVKTVETLTGVLAAVDTIASGRADLPGRVMLSLRTDKETVDIYLGPVWYLEQQGVKLAVNDRVEVKGSRVFMEGKPLIIANYVKKGSQVLRLRDEQGVPLWRGGPGR